MRKIELCLFLLAFASLAIGQPVGMNMPVQRSFKDRLYFGGNMGLQFGSQTVIGINPIIGYRVTDKFSAGVGVKYQYYRLKDPYFTYETNTYGGSIFGRYDILNGIFAYSEYEMLNLEVYDQRLMALRRRDITSWFVGGGYSQPLGSRSSVFLMILYNLTESSYTPYSNPLFRMGFGIGI